MEELNHKEVIFVFPPIIPNAKSRLVLKELKTESSERKIWIPRTIALLLRKHYERQQEIKKVLGDSYTDYDLVICSSYGRPVEGKTTRKKLGQLAKKHHLPNVTFHSLRHTSTTYKLIMTHGNIKAVQGDTEHSKADMVTNTYSHTQDEERRLTAVQLDLEFYSTLKDEFYRENSYYAENISLESNIKTEDLSNYKLNENKFPSSEHFKPENIQQKQKSEVEKLEELLDSISKDDLISLLQKKVLL